MRVIDADGHDLANAPFALRHLDSGEYGVFTFAIKNGVPERLPVGKYAFVALQGGVASLFDGPTGEVLIGGGAPGDQSEELTVRANVPVRSVLLRALQHGPAGLVDMLGDVIVEDEFGFRARFHAGARPSPLWLPQGRKLYARAHRLSAEGRIILQAEFVVPLEKDAGQEVLKLELVKI